MPATSSTPKVEPDGGETYGGIEQARESGLCRGSAELAGDVLMETVELGERHGAVVRLADVLSLGCPRWWNQRKADVVAEVFDFWLPAVPAKARERLSEPVGQGGEDEVEVTGAEALPAECVGAEVADLSRTDAEASSVDGESSAQNVESDHHRAPWLDVLARVEEAVDAREVG